jgi:O-acetyl-ADP-ribose deacetylase (regulator of RNase III)
MGGRIEVIIGRIEQLALDAVVNAANQRLLPGSGVDGALRAAAGPALTQRTREMPPIPVGGAVLTPGFNLPARFIIHTAAPIWPLQQESEEEKIAGLTRCYASAIAVADAYKLASIGFPCLGTGNYGWPRDAACDIAISASRQALAAAPGIARLVFCCFTDADAAPYRARLR